MICMNKEHVSLYLNMPVSTFHKCAYESVADHGNKYTIKCQVGISAINRKIKKEKGMKGMARKVSEEVTFM